MIGFVALLVACGARTELDAPELRDSQADVTIHDSAAGDAPSDAHDAGTSDVASDADQCDLGTVVSDVFGQVVYFAGGASLPKGHYTITYVDGCMKYSSSQGWTVNAYAAGPDVYWLVTGPSQQTLIVPPGTVGYIAGSGAFTNFDDCVNANLALPPIGFDFAGGTLGVWLADDPYSDNVPGESGRNPTWHLSACQGD